MSDGIGIAEDKNLSPLKPVEHQQYRFVLRPSTYFYGFEEVEIGAASGADIFSLA